MNELSDFPSPADFKDRRIGLIVFGVLETLLGLLCLLLLVGISFVMFLDPQLYTVLTPQMMGFILAFYGLLALALIWLGIGSILCRRWARVLLLIGAWSVLMLGIIVSIFYGMFGRKIYAGMLTDATATIVLVFSMVFQAILLIVLPGVMVLFYGSRNVIATCLARDPHTRWTDSCPMPVLATSLWLVLGSLSLLVMPICYRSVIPWFGVLVSGTPATLLLVICMVIGFYLAWGTYRLQMAAWWVCLISFTIFSMSAVVTLLKVDFIEFYRELGYSSEQMELLRNYNFFSGSLMTWWMVICYVLFIIFMAWIRKYFRKESAA
jgi:hypothetical protein